MASMCGYRRIPILLFNETPHSRQNGQNRTLRFETRCDAFPTRKQRVNEERRVAAPRRMKSQEYAEVASILEDTFI